jgi:acetyl esterase/lipase
MTEPVRLPLPATVSWTIARIGKLRTRLYLPSSHGGVTDPREILTRPAPPPDITLRYGNGSEQVADVWLPSRGPAPIVLFFHGGFWQAAYDRKHTGNLAAALAQAGFVACTPEYRRIGQPGGGWPGMFDDVATAVDELPGLIEEAAGHLKRGQGEPVLLPPEGGEPVQVPPAHGKPVQVAPGRVALAGHSAGGHLAMWSAGRHRLPAESPWHVPAPPCSGVVALAPVSDLAACHTLGLENRVTDRLLGGGPDRYPERYALADPARLIPLGGTVRIVHGTEDDRVPHEMSRDYIVRAVAAGDPVVLDELPGCGHFELIDPLSAAWPAVLAAFQAIAPL